MSTTISFQGISSGVQTDALVSAIMAQDSLPLVRLQSQQTMDGQSTTSYNTLQTDMTNLATSLQTLQYTGSGFGARTVTSSDTNNTYVTATASGAQTGNYDIQVSTVATAGRILPTLQSSGPNAGTPTLAVADPSGGTAASQVYTGSTPASFAVQGTDGVVKVITLNSGNNSLNGLASAINASGAGVTANIVNTGSGATPYQLVLTATNTGTGSTGGVVSLADVTSNDGSTTDNQLGIAAGKVDSLTAPTTVSGGLQSAAATNAVFTVDGVQLTRQTNTVTDAVNGLTLNLLQGGQTGTTALTVAEDTATITTSMQSVVTSYNQLLNDYTVASTATKDASGNIVAAPLSDDSTARNLISQLQSVFNGIPSGMSGSATYQSVGDLGITTNSDGTLALNTADFTTALQNNPDAAQNVFDFTGTTTNGVVNFSQGDAQTTALKVAFNITSYNGNTGDWSGTLSADGGPAVNVSGGNNQPVSGVEGTSMEGIQLNVTGTGTGSLSLTTGVAQSTQNAIASMTSYQGPIWNTIQSLAANSTALTSQIANEQSTLTNIQNQLELQFANMEATVSQLKTASGGLASLGS